MGDFYFKLSRNCDIESLKETALVFLAESENKTTTSTILINSNTQVVELKEPYENFEEGKIIIFLIKNTARI